MTISRAGHRGLSGLLGLLLLLGLLALPAAVGAAAAPDKGGSNTPKLDPAAIAAFAPNPAQAPQLGITPSAGPNGFWFGLAGVGFAANTTYQLRVVDADGDVIPFNDGTVRSNENGNLGQSLRFNNLPAGTVRVSLTTTGGETVASTTFQITAGGAPAATVSALPGEARQDFYVAFTAAGLTPGATYTRALVAPNGQTAAPPQASFQAEEDGVDILAIRFADTTPAGAYTYRISGPNGQVLTATVRIVATQAPTTTTATTSAATTTARTTTTTTAMPGLPNTGSGRQSGPPAARLIGGVALLALAGLALALRRRVA